jgi:NAD(P)-dependent dehydrogenase (short-subunit alcohol dehydrogenase family)
MATIALTGGASGIGATLSEQLRHDNHTIINVDIRDADVIADLTTNKGRNAALAEIAARAPDGLDGFVPLAGLGAGTGHPATLITALNYFGAVSLVEGLRPVLAKKSGSVVLLCSNSAPMSSSKDLLLDPLLDGDETAALKIAEQETGMEYMAGKRALAYWMRKNSFDYARAGIRINAVAPGPIQTPMVEALFETPGMKDAVDTLLRVTPIERMGQPQEVANAIRFLLSGDASYICGTVLYIDGGYDAATRPKSL